jgi:restriction system protein
MARRTGRQRRRSDLAPKLIGIGLLLGMVPMFLGGSPVGLALGPLAPFGWLALAVGCGLLWWQLRGQPAAAKSATAGPARAESETASNPVNHTQRSRPVDRATIEPVTDSVLLRSGQHHFGAPTWSAAVFDVIEWRRFEAVVETLFAQAGFETKTQSHGADEGIDIWLYSRSNPGVPVSVVQCKHWQAKRVGVDKVRELRGVMAAKNVSRGQFATTSTFTEDAIAFAKDNGINLLDVQGMLALIATRTEDQQDALLAAALEGEYWKPTCVNCGVKMVERTPRKGGTAFWGCASYPKCKTTMPKRSA